MIYSGILFFLIVIFIIFYNKFIKLRKDIEHSKSLVDVYLKKRWDLTPKLVNIVNYETKYELELLERITILRSKLGEQIDKEVAKQMNKVYQDVTIRLENNPSMKTNASFLQLQKELIHIEDELVAARRLYNINITKYNTYTNSFPFSLLAKLCGFQSYEYDNDIESIDSMKY